MYNIGFMQNQSIVHPIKLKKSNKTTIFLAVVMFLASISLFLGRIVVSSENPAKSIENKFSEILATTQTPVPYRKAPEGYELPSAKWIPQTFNNCGPAATAMTLQYFGFNVSQEETKTHLRTNPDDKNVFIGEISAYLAQDYGIQNKVLFNGNIDTLKTLVANGIYVVVEDWLHPNEDIGHVLIIRGYDDAQNVLIADDSYFGVGIKYPYSTWDEGQWKPYNREYMPVYKSDQENLVKSIIGENWNEKTMFQNSVTLNLKDTEKNPNDMYALFNLGSSYFELGDYEKAKEAFEKSQGIGWPHRMLWYSVLPVETYNKLGEWQKAIDTANLGLWYNDNYVEMHYQKYLAYKGMGNSNEADSELQKALSLDPNVTKKFQ